MGREAIRKGILEGTLYQDMGNTSAPDQGGHDQTHEWTCKRRWGGMERGARARTRVPSPVPCVRKQYLYYGDIHRIFTPTRTLRLLDLSTMKARMVIALELGVSIEELDPENQYSGGTSTSYASPY